jgi:ABC-type dipeptide/oligopeptide/nickel transport system permease subunit
LTEPARPPHAGGPDDPSVHFRGSIYSEAGEPRSDPGMPTDQIVTGSGLAGSELVYESGLELQARSQWAYARRRFLRHRLAMGSLVLLVVILVIGFLSRQIAPHDPNAVNFGLIGGKAAIIHAPTTEGTHLFGTDLLGRDYLSRVLYAIRTSASVAFLVAFISTLIGTTVGAIAGYFGGWIDNLLMRFTDLVLTLPLLAVLLVASASLGRGPLNLGLFSAPQQYRVALIISLLIWTGIARVVRGVFLSLREKEYVEAAKAAGAGDTRIILRHILPNSMGPIIVNMTLTTAGAILLESALSFLGFGIKPPTPALGLLISDGATLMQTAWWLVVFPGVMIMAIVLCINFIGDGLRDALDPTQRVRA